MKDRSIDRQTDIDRYSTETESQYCLPEAWEQSLFVFPTFPPYPSGDLIMISLLCPQVRDTPSYLLAVHSVLKVNFLVTLRSIEEIQSYFLPCAELHQQNQTLHKQGLFKAPVDFKELILCSSDFLDWGASVVHRRPWARIRMRTEVDAQKKCLKLSLERIPASCFC